MKILSSLALTLFITTTLLSQLSKEAREKGFVYLHEVDPSIIISPRYATNENFVGKPVDGYAAEEIVLMRQAADALKKAQEIVKKDGYCLVVYDAYRPQRAVNHFMRWGADIGDLRMSSDYYPRVNKTDVFEFEYVARRSGHSRGSTVDITLIKDGEKLHPIIHSERSLSDGFELTFLDDGTIDMGTSFDLFDEASHHDSLLISERHLVLRNYLKSVMESCGFKAAKMEWWHYTLKDEPYSASDNASYFDFAIE